MIVNKWTDVAELIGIAAIVASLTAVVVELRQTQHALTAATHQARAFDSIGLHQYAAESDYILDILISTKAGDDAQAVAALREIDRARLQHYIRIQMPDLDNEFYQYRNGFLDKGFFEGSTKRVVRNWAPRWRQVGLSEARPEFKEFVDSVLTE